MGASLFVLCAHVRFETKKKAYIYDRFYYQVDESTVRKVMDFVYKINIQNVNARVTRKKN